MANATVSNSSPSPSQLMVSGDSRTFTQVMVRSRPPAPASSSPLLNPPSAIASRTVSAMGVTSMPYRGARVKDQSNQGLLVASHNGRSRLRLLPSPPESTGVDGAYSPPEPADSNKRGGLWGRKQGGTAGGFLSSLQQSMPDQASCKEVPMASYTIEIPDGLHHEIQERRHQIDVAGICTQALTAAVAERPNSAHQFGRDHEVTESINRMFSG